MKKMNWKKWLVVVGVVLALCLVLVFAACRKQPTPTDPTTVPTTNIAPTTGNVIVPTTVEPTTVAPTTEPTKAPTTEPTTAPTTEPTTAPTTVPPTTEVPVTEPPATEAPTEAPTVPETTAHVHVYEINVIRATCTEHGHTIYTCACGYEYSISEEDYLGHDFTEWVITKEPTVEETGDRERTCNRCGFVEKDFVAPLDAETGEKYESFIDPRLVNLETRSGTSYSYMENSVAFADGRTWGEKPSVYIEEDGSLRAIYFLQDGTKVTQIISPVDGYFVSGVVYDDGDYRIIKQGALG